MTNLFVGNLNFRTTEVELRSLFEQFGELRRVQIITDRETGRARGFGFVEMEHDDDASKAIAELNGKELGGRALLVDQARPKPERMSARGTNENSRGQSSRDDYQGFERHARTPRW